MVVVGAGLAYFGVAVLALRLFATNESPAAIWASTGVLVAALLVSPRRLWPGILFGAFFCGGLANFVSGKPLGTSVALGVVDAIEGILNVAVLSWCLRRQVTFARLRDFSALLFCGAIGANGVAALGGASVFHFFAGATFWPSWWMWWLSNGIGILVVTPCIVSWVNLKLHWRHPVRPSRWIEAITVALVLAAVAMIVFEGVTVYSLVLPYLTFPLLIWAALRLGVPGASTGALILASIAVWSTAHDLGPFAFASGTVYSKLLQVQSFIAAALACSLVPAIVIAEREETQRELRSSEARLAMAQQIAGLGSFEYDTVRRRMLWSDELFRITGRDGSLGAPNSAEFWQFVHAEDRRPLRDSFERTIAESAPLDSDFRFHSPDRSLKYLHVIARPIVDNHGRVAKVLGTVMDMTERRHIEDELRQAQKMEAVGRLAGGVAHDFNNLLGIIIGYAELALAEVSAGSSIRKQLEPISKAASRAASLTAQLLAFSRKQVLKPEVFSLNLVVTDLEKMLRRIIGEEIELVTNVSRSTPSVKADPGQIEQVILNLVVNAKDAMPNGGTLIISTSEMRVDELDGAHSVPPGRYAVLSVTDTGHGMDEQTKANIFEPFFTTKEKGKGTGLGLAMVYGIVNQSHGHTWVESEPGEGAAFHICLPAVEPDAEKPIAASQPSALRRSETVLLVEDEQPLRQLIHQVLVTMGCTVLEASSGDDAVRIASEKDRDIDIVLTDVIMPHMNGFELARRIGEVRPDIKVLYMSGYSDEMIARHDRTVGQPSFIQKPFKPEDLRAKIQELADSKRAGQLH
jgi:PAS domain S-box-containing protein